MSHKSHGRGQSQTDPRNCRGGPLQRRAAGPRGGAWESPWTSALASSMAPPARLAHGETGSGRWPSLLLSIGGPGQDVNEKGIYLSFLAHSCDRYLRSPSSARWVRRQSWAASRELINPGCRSSERVILDSGGWVCWGGSPNHRSPLHLKFCCPIWDTSPWHWIPLGSTSDCSRR